MVVVKHANPCGVAVAEETFNAWRRALACDPVSAYGGIVALNRILDERTAATLSEIFLEVVIAPGADAEASAHSPARKNLRLLVTNGMPDPTTPGLAVRSIAGGLFDSGARFRMHHRCQSQGRDEAVAECLRTRRSSLRLPCRQACEVECNRLRQERRHGRHRCGPDEPGRFRAHRRIEGRGSGKGGGETARRTEGAVVASDAFFPFADGLITAADSGVTAIIQPGGSLRDEEVIRAADERGLAMVFTGMRHFRH